MVGNKIEKLKELREKKFNVTLEDLKKDFETVKKSKYVVDILSNGKKIGEFIKSRGKNYKKGLFLNSSEATLQDYLKINKLEKEREEKEKAIQEAEKERIEQEKQEAIQEAEKEKRYRENISKVPKNLRFLANEDGEFLGFSNEDYSNMQKGRGYVDNKRSTNSYIANSEGKFPKTQAGKILGVNPKMIEKYLLPSEYHHTSSYYNLTDFYDIRPYFYIQNNMNKELLEYLEAKRVDEEEINDTIKEYKEILKKMKKNI